MKTDWFCQKCNSYVDGSSVTFEETHDLCGNIVFTEESNALKIAKEFYPGVDYIEQGVDLNPAFREGFVQGYTLHKNILYFTNDKNLMVKYDDQNIVISHDNKTGEFIFNRIRFRGDQGETLTPHYV